MQPLTAPRLGFTSRMAKSFEFLEELLKADPTNAELIKTYSDLCLEDAKLEAAKQALVEEHNHKERIERLKLDAETLKDFNKGITETNKAVAQIKDRPFNLTLFQYHLPSQHSQSLGMPVRFIGSFPPRF